MRVELNIVSHNALWFQGVPFEPEEPDGPLPAIVSGLAALYGRYRPDVLCLQEVQSEGAFAAARASLRLEGSYCPGCTHRQYGGAVFWRGGSLVADARMASAPPQRMWQCVAMGGNGSTVRVCNLHLASARQLGEDAATCSRLDDLRGLLEHRLHPHVLAGDFNEGPQGATTGFLMQHGYLDTAMLTGHRAQSTGIGKDRSDQIWVHESLADGVAEFEVLSWQDLVTDAPGKEYLSDHLPLHVRLAFDAPAAP